MKRYLIITFNECFIGTGTAIGDPTEINAIGRFIESYRLCKPQNQVNSLSGQSYASQSMPDTQIMSEIKFDADKINKILIGSVKSNIGHLESAAGVAALIKVLLMMKHEQIVPSLHVKKDKSNVNKKIDLERYGLDISVALSNWIPNEKGERICCVNCFGFGGSNTHAIVVQNRQNIKSADFQSTIICLSGLSKTALKENIEALANDITSGHHLIQDISYTSVYHRDHYSYRTLVFGTSTEDIKKQLEQKLTVVDKIESTRKTKLVFVFCGVGTTWKGMCREMMDTQTVFRKTVSEIDELLLPLTGWSIAEKFRNDSDYSDPFLNHIAIFCTQIALFEQWKSIGISPDTVIGQSVGEVAASYASGALCLKDAVQVIFLRSQILAKMTGGKMMVVGNIAVTKVDSLCKTLNNRVTIAVFSSPMSCTVSGDEDAVDQLKATLEEMNKTDNTGIMIVPLSVQCAYHSHHMDPCIQVIENKLVFDKTQDPTIDQISTVTGEFYRSKDFQTGKYWAENIRKPVLFMDAIVRSSDKNALNVFIEIGPRPVLRAHLANIMGSKLRGISLPSMHGSKENYSMFTSLNSLYEFGVEILWENLIPREGKIVPIPRYSLQRTKVLHIPKVKQRLMKGNTNHESDSHLFMRRNADGTPEFMIQLNKENTSFVYDHFLFNSVLVPGATYIEAAFEIGFQKSSLTVFEICVSIEFMNTFMPANDKECFIDIDVDVKESDEHIFMVRKDAKLLAQGKIYARKDRTIKHQNIQEMINRCRSHRTKVESYKCLENLHFRYGESLSVIQQSWSSTNECVVEFTLPDSVMKQRKVTHMHPSVIDGMLQAFGILSSTGSQVPTLPKGVGAIVINRPPEKYMYGYSVLLKKTETGNHYNSLLLTKDGDIVAEIYDFYTKAMSDTTDLPTQMTYCSAWREMHFPASILQSDNEVSDDKKRSVFICSKRFRSFFLEEDQQIDYIDIETGLTQDACSRLVSLRSILFAPFFHITEMDNDGQVIYESIKKSFMYLQIIIQSLKENNENVPVFIVTENVMGHKETNVDVSNVCGSELWGMVRSAVCEGAYENFNLIDMTSRKENFIPMKAILKCNMKGYNEIMIENGKCHSAELFEVSERSIPTRREIQIDLSEDTIMKSSSTTAVTDQYFDTASQTFESNNIKQECKVLLEALCLHSPTVFPLVHATNIEPDEGGYPVIGIEGQGYKTQRCRGKEKQKVVFCYPVPVSTIVSVPHDCVFDLASLPIYVPGIFTVGVIVWNIMHTMKLSSSICVVVNDEIEYYSSIIAHFVSATYCQVIKQSAIHEIAADKAKGIRTLCVLAHLTSSDFGSFETIFPTLQEIVSIEEYISKVQKTYLRMTTSNILITILKTEDMFAMTEITKTIPKVYQCLMSIDNIHISSRDCQASTDSKRQTDILSLPYEVLLLNNEMKTTRIPFKVSERSIFRKNGCYIIIGGLTGLGWEILKFVAQLGVKYIVTFSRRLPSKNKINEIEQIKKKHLCQVIPLQVDITNLCQVRNAFLKLKGIVGSNSVIRGIFHGGGVTRDTFLRNMTENDLEAVLLPKVLGTWNLHIATLDLHLDFFVMHSSVVSIFGNQGQCNYGAGNSFQDAFAHYRRSLGLCGQSINWSTLSLGMATETQELEKYLKGQGFHYLTKDEILKCFMQAMMMNRAQIIFGKFDWHKIKDIPALKLNPRKVEAILRTVPNSIQKNDETNTEKVGIAELSNLEPAAQRNIIQEKVRMKVAECFVVDENTLTESTRILSLGIDSMAAMSFINAMFDITNVRIPIGTLFDESTTLELISNYFVKNINTEAMSTKSETVNSVSKAMKCLEGNITFMQKSLLDDFFRYRFSKNLIRQVDFEISGLKLQKSDMKIVFSHLAKINPDLRRVYGISDDGTYTFSVLESHNIDIEEVDFTSICEEHSVDKRDKVRIDITKEFPIRVMVAFREKRTRIRIFLQAIFGDLFGITNLFREMGEILTCHLKKEELPLKHSDVDPAQAIRTVLMPQVHILRKYWSSKFQDNIQPFTFSDDISGELDERYWTEISQTVPTVLVEKVMQFLIAKGISMYHFIMSVYLVILHEKTGNDFIPLLTYVNMRSHVLQLQSVLQSCTNSVPVIGDLRNLGKVSTFLKKTSDDLNQMTQHSAYPYELIQEEMRSDYLKQHIGRHRFVMENMTEIQNHFEHDDVEIKIGNIFYKRHVFESTLHVEYDTKQNMINIQFGYNGKAITDRKANDCLEQMHLLMYKFIQDQNKEVQDLLKETEPATNDSSHRTLDNYNMNLCETQNQEKQTLYVDKLEKRVDDDKQTVVLTGNINLYLSLMQTIIFSSALIFELNEVTQTVSHMKLNTNRVLNYQT